LGKDKELENLLKLKQAIINDLKKKGKVIENNGSRRKIELSSKLKKREERILTVDFSRVEIMRDIDSQDYDAPDFLVIEKLKKYLDNERDARRLEILTGLLRVLELENEKAVNLFQGYAFDGDSKAAYNYAETLLFLGKYDEALKFISQFSKAFKADLYTYLSILEILVYFFKDWQKIEKIYNFFKISDNSFSRVLKVGYLIATSNFEDAYNEFTKAIVTGEYKNLLDIYSIVINKNLGNIDKALQTVNILLNKSKEHTCSVVHSLYLKDRNYDFTEKLNYCPYARFLMAKKVYSNGDFKSALSYLEPLLNQNYPSALMLAGVIKMFQNDFNAADEYWLKLSKLVPLEIVIGILKKPIKSDWEKLNDEIGEKNRLQAINPGTAATLSSILSSSKNIGFKMIYPEIEFIRLFFGERTCKRMYSKG